MSHLHDQDRDEDIPEVTIIEEWDDAAHRKYDYHEKLDQCSSILLVFMLIGIFAVLSRATAVIGPLDSIVLMVGTRALLIVASLGLFGSFGAGLYYQWRSNSIDSTITYKLEHENGDVEDITEREVAAISLGYERDYYDDVPDEEVPCARCLEVHDPE